MEVIWSDLAIESFNNVLSYIDGFFGERLTQLIAKDMISFTYSIGAMPRMGKKISLSSKAEEYRYAIYKQNQIYYRISKDKVHIIVIWDGRQDPKKLRRLLLDYKNRQSDEQ